MTRNIAVSGTLDVTGSTNLNDGALGGKLTIAKDKLTVVSYKATGLGGALTVDGATTLKGDPTVQGQQLDLDGGSLAGVCTLSGAKEANNNTVPVTLEDVGTLRGTTDGQGNTGAVKVARDLDLHGGNLAGLHTLSGAKDANNNTVPVTLADVGTLRGTTDGQGGTSALKVVGDLDLDGVNLAGVRTLSAAKDANNNGVPVSLADVGTLRGTTDGLGNNSAVKVAGDLDLDDGNLAGVHTLSDAKDANNITVPVTLADVGTLRGTTDGCGNTSAVKVVGNLDLDGGNLAGVRTLSGAKDATNNTVLVTLADVGTLRGTTDRKGGTSAAKVAGDLDLDGGNVAGVHTLSGANDANNNPVPVTLADVGTLSGTTDGQGGTSAVKVAGDLDLDGGNLAGFCTLSGANDVNNNPVPVTLADAGTLRGTTDGQGGTNAVKVVGDLDLDGVNLAGVRTLSGAKDANNNTVPVTLADVGTLRGTTDGLGNNSAVKVAGDLDLDGGKLAGVRTLSGAKDATNNTVPVTLADVGTLRGTTDRKGGTSTAKVSGDLDLDGGNVAGVHTLSGAKDASNNPVPVTLADVGTLSGTTDGQGGTSAVKVAGDLDLDGGNLAGVRTLPGAKDAINNTVPVTLADVGTLRGTTDGQGNTSAVKVAGNLDLDGGNLAGFCTLSDANDANNNPVPVTLADVGTLRGKTDRQGGTSAVKVVGNLDLDGSNLAGVRTLSGAKDANNNPVPVTLADVGTLRGTTDGQGGTSAVKVAGNLDLDGGNLAVVCTLSGAKDASNNPVPVTLADVGTLSGTTDRQGGTSAVKVAGDLDLDGGNLAGIHTLSGAKDANNNPVPVTLADVGTPRGTTDGHGNTSAVKVAGDQDLDGGNLALVRTLSGAKDANNNPVPVTLADVGTLRGTTDGQGNTSAVRVAGNLDLDGGNLAGFRTLSGANDANNNPVPVTLADVGTLRGTTDGQGGTSAVKVVGNLDLDGGNLAGIRTLSGAKDANNNPVPVTLADVGTLRGTTDGQGNTSAVKVTFTVAILPGSARCRAPRMPTTTPSPLRWRTWAP